MNEFIVIGGPCSIESFEQLNEIYCGIHENVDIFRGGAFKPRTSHTSFQGLGATGIEYLKKVSSKPTISEVMDTADLELFQDVDFIQIGARNMQNFSLLKKVAAMNKKVLLKRGFSNTVEEFLAAANYLEAYGAKEIYLCERGIRTFSDSSRFTLDIAAVIKLKKETKYKVIVDVSHAAGDASMIEELAFSVAALNADGIMIECHNDPQNALSDVSQQLTIKQFNDVILKVRKISSFVAKLKN